MKPKRFAVIGDPISHSLSPVMHGAALRTLGLPHTFEALRVPKEALPATLDRVRRGELHGLNVTVPHKIEAMRLCDVFTDEVAATGAVNTVFLDATGRLVGSNTDVDGLRADLLAEGIVPKRVLLLGTGGAARAALVAITSLDAEVVVAGRDDANARKLVHDAGRGAVASWSTLVAPTREGGPISSSSPYDLIVNATSAGMAGAADGTPIADAWTRAPKASSCIAYDIVYRPRETLFLQRATAEGHRAVSGIGMLVEQGARALSIFLGIPIDVTVKRAMRDAVMGVLS